METCIKIIYIQCHLIPESGLHNHELPGFDSSLKDILIDGCKKLHHHLHQEFSEAALSKELQVYDNSRNNENFPCEEGLKLDHGTKLNGTILP